MTRQLSSGHIDVEPGCELSKQQLLALWLWRILRILFLAFGSSAYGIMHSVSVNHLAASIVHLSSSVDSALMTPGHFALWAQLLHRYLLCEEGLRLTMIPPLNTMNTVEHHWTLWLLLPGSNYIESGRITKTIVLSELSTMFNRY